MAFGRVKVLNAVQQLGVAARTHFGVAKFALVAALHLAAQLLGHGLHAVANAQHGQAQLEHGIGRAVVHLVHAGVAAREDDALELAVPGPVAHPVAAHVAGVDFAVHMRFADAAGDELRDLRAEVEDEDFLVLHGDGPPQKVKMPTFQPCPRAQKETYAITNKAMLGAMAQF